MAGYCKACATMRSVAPCHKCGGDLKEPHPSWGEPVIPDVEPIRRLAREVGYAIGVHGSQERDLDLIAAPWAENAVSAQELADHIAQGINGRVLAPEHKPLGRWSCNIQIDGWFKLIDLSVSPGGDSSTDTPSAAMLAAIERHRALNPFNLAKLSSPDVFENAGKANTSGEHVKKLSSPDSSPGEEG